MDGRVNSTVEEAMQQVKSANNRGRVRGWIVGACLFLSLAAGIAAWNFEGRKGAMLYQTRPVRFGDLEITVTATGNLAATNEVDVGSELSGIITSMTADYNDIVKRDQALVYLDDAKYKAAVMKSRAEISSAKAAYEEALSGRKADEKKMKRYEMTRELTNGKLPSEEDLEEAQADFERAVAAVEAAAAAIRKAQATLKSDEADLKKTVIYSPINGIVLSRNAERGQTVAASLEAPVLYTLAEDLRRMELQVDVDEADVGQVKPGQWATFPVDAFPDRTFQAQITQVRYGAETTDNVVTYKAVLRVENPDLLLRPEMTATANIVVLKIEKTLLVPNTALRFSPPGPDEGPKNRRGLLNALIPGPPRPSASKTELDGTAALGPNGAFSRVWVLKDNLPVPVTVTTGASDGAVTAVTSEQLRDGTRLIVNVTTSG